MRRAWLRYMTLHAALTRIAVLEAELHHLRHLLAFQREELKDRAQARIDSSLSARVAMAKGVKKARTGATR